jgi:hypothetical protein
VATKDVAPMSVQSMTLLTSPITNARRSRDMQFSREVSADRLVTIATFTQESTNMAPFRWLRSAALQQATTLQSIAQRGALTNVCNWLKNYVSGKIP